MSIEIFTFALGIIALNQSERLLAIALIYISLAFPIYVKNEVRKYIIEGLKNGKHK